jgi:hypothetical protein
MAKHDIVHRVYGTNTRFISDFFSKSFPSTRFGDSTRVKGDREATQAGTTTPRVCFHFTVTQLGLIRSHKLRI